MVCVCNIPTSENVTAVVVRRCSNNISSLQTLLICGRANGRGFYPFIEDHQLAGNWHLGDQLPALSRIDVSVADSRNNSNTASQPPKSYRFSYLANAAVFDPVTNATYFSDGYALFRMDVNGEVTYVAGHATERRPEEGSVHDGPATTARFGSITALCADGHGGLLVADAKRLRHVQLCAQPGQLQRGEGQDARNSNLESAGRLNKAAKRQVGDTAGATATAGGSNTAFHSGLLPNGSSSHSTAFNVTVTTLVCRADAEEWTAVACDPATAAILIATDTALYRLPLSLVSSPPDLTKAAADGRDSKSSDCRTFPGKDPLEPPCPLLIVGKEGVEGYNDGSFSNARFTSITGLAVDARGGVAWVVDDGRLRRVDVGTCLVTTTLDSLPEGARATAVLPNGCLAICSDSSDTLTLVALGLSVPSTQHMVSEAAADTLPRSVPHGPCPGRLPVSAASPLAKLVSRLLSGEPDPTADVTLVFSGGVRIRAHRAVLAAASEYFRSLFYGSGFVESTTAAAAATTGQELAIELADADPRAFAVILQYCYCGGGIDSDAGDPLPGTPPSLLRPVAELADWLLLVAPGLLREATRRLLAATWPASVVDDLLWVEARGPAFQELREGLQLFFSRHASHVAAQAPDSLERLAGASPKLMAAMFVEAVRPTAAP